MSKQTLIIDKRISFSAYITSLNKYFLSFDDNLKTKTLCPICQNRKAAKIVIHKDDDEEHKTSMLLECNCGYMWYLCCCCGSEHQPKLLLKTDFRKKKAIWQQKLNATIMNHDHVCHLSSGDDSQSFEGNCHSDVESTNFDRQFSSCLDQVSKRLSDKRILSSLKNCFEETFVNCHNEKMSSEKNNVLMECVIAYIHERTYSPHLVRKHWCKNESCQVDLTDVSLFLRIVRCMLPNSRSQNKDLVTILSMVEDRRDKSEKKKSVEICKMQNDIHCLRSSLNSAFQMLLNLGVSQDQLPIQSSVYCMNPDKIHDVKSDLHSGKILARIEVPIPRTISQARNTLEGKNCFINNLCTATVLTRDCDGYAYCNPTESLMIALCTGLDVEMVRKYEDDKAFIHRRSLFHTKYIRKRVVEEIEKGESGLYKVILGLWSDGYNAGGNSKGIRSEVKVTTMHIYNPNMTTKHVFPLAIGRSKADHKSMRNYLLAEIYKLCSCSRKCYLPSQDRIVDIQFILGYVIQDRPEHSEFTGFMSHSGTFSTVPGMSCPIYIKFDDGQSLSCSNITVTKSMASCERCFLRRKICMYSTTNEVASESHHCDECSDWNLYDVTYSPSSEYPRDSIHY